MVRPTTPSMRKKSINGRMVKAAPQRTCVSCRQIGEKRGLVRLVRTPDGRVELDSTGKRAGRGAYLCAKPECWDAGINGGKLEHSLKVTMTREDRQQLLEKGLDLIKEKIG